MRAVRFNPPPGWPVPPGWSPPPGWEPDPTWPPAPPGWQFWIEVPPPSRGRGRLVAAGAAVVVLLVVLAVGLSQLLGTRPPPTGSDTTGVETSESPTSEEASTSDTPTDESPSGESDEPAPEIVAVDTAGGVEGVATAETGDCMMWDDIGATFPAVPCSDAHDAEVYAVFDISGATDYPGEDAVNALANSECVARFEAFVGVRLVDSDLAGHYFTPTASTWDRGDRQVLCVAYLADGSTVTETFADSAR